MFVQKQVLYKNKNLGMFAIRADRDYVIEEDYFKAGRKIKEAKKLESKLEY